MTQTDRQQREFYQRTGLALLGISFEQAMAKPALRIAIECGAKSGKKGKAVPCDDGITGMKS